MENLYLTRNNVLSFLAVEFLVKNRNPAEYHKYVKMVGSMPVNKLRKAGHFLTHVGDHLLAGTYEEDLRHLIAYLEVNSAS